MQSSSSSGPFGAALEEEREKRIALEKVCRHREDMIELAEKEMNKLQAELGQYDEMKQQSRGLLIKYQSLKESLRRIE